MNKCLDCGIEITNYAKRCRHCYDKLKPIIMKGGNSTSFKKGQHNITEFKKGNIPWNKGLKTGPLSEEHKHKLKGRISWSKNKTFLELPNICHGKNHPFWKGGTTPLIKSIKRSNLYRLWRNSVFERDNWTCQECFHKNIYINAHHKKTLVNIIKNNNIKTFEDACFCKDLWDINNGETVCIDCHERIHNKTIPRP